MTYDEFEALCERQWENGYGAQAYELPPISSVINPVTGEATKIVRHENHAVVERPPHPPPTTQRVKI